MGWGTGSVPRRQDLERAVSFGLADAVRDFLARRWDEPSHESKLAEALAAFDRALERGVK